MTAPVTTGNPLRLQAIGAAWAAGDRFILLDACLDVAVGECVVLVGENGAGKSTLLDLLAGVRAPARGSLRLDGVPLPDIDPGHLARRIARLGHRPGLYLDLSAHENVSLFAALANLPVTLADVTAELTLVGIAPRDQHRPVRGFSRGMLQRTALARILMSGADVWVLDEPSTGLDVAGTELLVSTLRRARERGATIVLATHDPALLPVADRKLCVRGGLVVPEQEVA
jgi:heme ABC exporter ATP-binding subunit CcmA